MTPSSARRAIYGSYARFWRSHRSASPSGMPFRSRVVGDLVAADPPDREVARLRVAEVEAAHARARRRRARLGETDPRPLGVEQREQRLLLGVVGARRIAERRADAAEPLGDPLLVRQRLGGRVPLVPRTLVETLGERLGEPVGERADHDRAVVVVVGGERVARAPRCRGSPTANAPTWSCEPGLGGRDEVRERAIRPRVGVVALLAEHREADAAVEDDVVTLGAWRARTRRRPRAVQRPVPRRSRPGARSRPRTGRARPRPSRGRRGSPGSGP